MNRDTVERVARVLRRMKLPSGYNTNLLTDASALLENLLDRAEQAEQERDALSVMAAVCEWQARNDYHPLTCGNDQCRADDPDSVLVPLIRGGTCVLACPQCDYTQTHIPNIVLSKEPAQVETLREMQRVMEMTGPPSMVQADITAHNQRKDALAAAIAQAEALQAAERETAGRFLDDFTAAQEGGICATRRWTVEAMREFLTQWEAYP